MARTGKNKEPTWNPKDLSRHYQKHPAGEDKECLKDVLKPVTPRVTEEQYRLASLEVFEEHWLQYEAKAWEVAGRKWRETRAYYVDDRLLVLVTDVDRQAIVTRFHDHWHSGGKHVMSENNKLKPDERRERYRRFVDDAERRGLMADLKVIYEAT